MKRLLIMRHAKSDWSNSLDDYERPLNKRGLEDAVKMGACLKQQALIPDVIVSSPANRTRQTTEIVCEQLELSVDSVLWDQRLYEADLADLFEVISEYRNNGECMLLIGHNPGLDYLLKHLSDEIPRYSTTGKLMSTAAIAVMEFGKSGFNGKMGSASVVKLLRPKEL